VIICIKNGILVDPVRRSLEHLDLLIEHGKIIDIVPSLASLEAVSCDQTIDASGKFVIPGLIDMHVHLREPGYEYKETVASGTMAAVAGGFSAVACMPNTLPPNDCRAVTEFILRQAERAGRARVYPIAAITVGQKGKSLTEFGDLKNAGAVGVSDDGFPVTNSEIMRRAMEYANYHGLAVISHSEDLALSSNGVIHEGQVSTRIGLPGIPSASEEIMVFREIALSRLTGCPVHIAHVSTAGSVELIRRAKDDGLPVTAETAPHYFTLDHSALTGYDTSFKVKPPLRTKEDVIAVKQGLSEGVIDVIATDHAPHSPMEKDVTFDEAEFGMIGLETALPLTLNLVREGILDLPDAIAKLSCNPASILHVSGGCLQKGSDADLAIIDTDCVYKLLPEDIVSKSKNSPFVGRILKGRNELTMVGGNIVFERKT